MEKHPAFDGEEKNVSEDPSLDDGDGVVTEGEREEPPKPEELLAVTQSALEQATSQLKELAKEKEGLQDRYVRLQADFDNFRRRTRKEMAEAGERAVAKFVLEILPLIDNLQLAVQSQSQNETNQGVVAGVKMVLDQFTEVFSSYGVQPIAALGKEYDPTVHEALMTVETDEVSPGCILEELRCGYIQRERVLRPSLVKVAAAAAKKEPVDGEKA
ncbi:MAG: nucleotide exchange factor GrpE [Limnochordia bacterium]|nr:nucleotide exchange factor GrpE [Limnochordia bacterium]MDD4517150.1 nucleotide exchange factor GrpE [Limnochordia bacterium]